MGTSYDPPRVGLLASGPLRARIRKILASEDIPLVFDLLPDRLDGRPEEDRSLLVVIGDSGSTRDRSLLQRVRQTFPRDPVVVCSDPERRAFPMLQRDADGVVPLDRLEESLGPAIRAVHAGLVAYPREAIGRPRAPELTNREKQALSMVIMGLTNQEIAEKLFVSENTVKSHLNTAYKKLGVHSRSEAHRLITDPDQGLGTGILAITQPGLARGRRPKSPGT